MKYFKMEIDKDINIDSYVSILNLIKEFEFQTIFYSEVDYHDKYIILRHDVDICLNKAYEMSKIEYKNDIVSSYFIMLHNPLYNPFAKTNINKLRKMLSYNHNICLHFDPKYYKDISEKNISYYISSEIELLSKYLDRKVYYFSFHQPPSFSISKDFKLEGVFESVYNKKFFNDIKYISDSGGQWREKSIRKFLKSSSFSKIHFNSHPGLYFNPNHNLLNDRLNSIIEDQLDMNKENLMSMVNNYDSDTILYDKKLNKR